METKDLTLMDFANRQTKLVVVKHSKNNFSTFLVADCEKPQIPGYPACCLTYYKSLKEAHRDIEKTYKRIGYTPKYPETGCWTAGRA